MTFTNTHQSTHFTQVDFMVYISQQNCFFFFFLKEKKKKKQPKKLDQLVVNVQIYKV